EAIALETALDVVEGARLARAARLALPGRDGAGVGHQRIGGHRGEEGGFPRIRPAPVGAPHPRAPPARATSGSRLAQSIWRRPSSRSRINSASRRVSGISMPTLSPLRTSIPSWPSTSVLRLRTARSRQIPVLVLVCAR